MPRPTSGTTIQRSDLGAIAYEYMLSASQRGFVGLELLPIFEVERQTADYPKIPIEALLKLPASLKRAPRSAYNRDDYQFEMGTYACKEYGREEPVDDVEAALYRRFFDAEEVAVMRAVDVLLRSQEKRIADLLFSVTNIPNHHDVTTEWSNAAQCTPLADVKAAKTAMRAATGLEPNVIAMSKKVFDNVMVSSEIQSRLQYTNPIMLGNDEANKALLAQYFGVSRVLVGNAIYDAAKKNKTASITDIWDDEYVLLARVSSGGNDLRDPCLGRTFLWIEDSPSNIVTEQYREEQTRSNVYRVRHHVDEAIVFAGAGYLLGNITA